MGVHISLGGKLGMCNYFSVSFKFIISLVGETIPLVEAVNIRIILNDKN